MPEKTMKPDPVTPLAAEKILPTRGPEIGLLFSKLQNDVVTVVFDLIGDATLFQLFVVRLELVRPNLAARLCHRPESIAQVVPLGLGSPALAVSVIPVASPIFL